MTDAPPKVALTIACVIPTHDRDDLLRESLASVLAQTRVPDEIIVVDDTGSMKTADLVEQLSRDSAQTILYVDARATALGTAGSSRNIGEAASTAEVVAFLDDDDYWLPTFVDRVLVDLEATGADMAVTWMDFLEAGVRRPGVRVPAGLEAKDVVARNPGLTGTNFAIKSSVFRAVGGFDGDLWVSNDQDFFVRALDSGCAYVATQEVLALHRIHGSARITQATPRRELGLARYIHKHSHRLTLRDRLFLYSIVYGVRSGLATSVASRSVNRALQFAARGLSLRYRWHSAS